MNTNIAPAAAAEAPPPKQRVATGEPKTAAPAADRPKAVGGFVAVLGYQKSQMEAMKMMADLQQRYEPLRDKKIEIIQSEGPVQNLGVIYRVVVGPRGSNQAAREVCGQLYQAGMPANRCYALAP